MISRRSERAISRLNRKLAEEAVVIPKVIPCSCNRGWLPVSESSIERARGCEWKRLTPLFNRVFYKALGKAGFPYKQIWKELECLEAHRNCLAVSLTHQQVRGAIGLEHGVFGARCGSEGDRTADSSFNVAYTEGFDAEVALLDDQQANPSSARSFTPQEYPVVEADALTYCEDKPDQVSMEEEYRWVRSNLFEWPEFSKAPSRGAIKDWLAVHRPGSEGLLREFLTMAWSKRMASGDPRKRESVFSGSEDDEKAALADLERRLGG